MEDRTKFQGMKLPRFLYHGTTMQFIDNYTQKDGSYRVPFGLVIDAINGDARGWPRNMEYEWIKATVVIDTQKAYGGLRDVFNQNHFRFDHLPAGSYKFLTEGDCSFEYGSLEYQRELSILEKELLKKK